MQGCKDARMQARQHARMHAWQATYGSCLNVAEAIGALADGVERRARVVVGLADAEQHTRRKRHLKSYGPYRYGPHGYGP